MVNSAAQKLFLQFEPPAGVEEGDSSFPAAYEEELKLSARSPFIENVNNLGNFLEKGQIH